MGFLVENKLADDAVRRNVAAGLHYFDADTLRFFGSKVHEGYDLGEDGTLVIMSNRSKSSCIVDGRRHYYLTIVRMDGSTSNIRDREELNYDVTKGTGYWMSLSAARNAAKRLQKEILHPATA